MPRPRGVHQPVPRESLALACAWYSALGLKQDEIMEVVGIGSQAEVSRLLGFARDEKWLVQEVKFPKSLSPDAIEGIKQLGFKHQVELERRVKRISEELSATGTPTLQSVHVVATGKAEAAQAVERFGRPAAEVVGRLLQGASSVVVAWGRTISAIVDAMPRPESTGIKCFIPICGDPLNYPAGGVSPSIAANRLADIFEVPAEERLSLQGIPARIPAGLVAEDSTNVLRKYVNWSNNYRRIFGGDGGGEPALIGRVDMMLTSIGDVRTSGEDPFLKETAEDEGIDQEQLSKLAVGNLGGVWLPRPDSSSEAVLRVKEINQHWLGAQQEHFEACARRATKSKRLPGVVAVAVEATKADVIKHALGMINRLIISRDLAEALL